MELLVRDVRGIKRLRYKVSEIDKVVGMGDLRRRNQVNLTIRYDPGDKRHVVNPLTNIVSKSLHYLD